MENCLANRRFLYIFLLITLVGFLVLPKICLADDFEDIDLEKMGKYLELSSGDAQKLINTLRQVLTTEGIFLWSSGDVTDEKTAAGVILLNVVKIEILNHLLVSAPIEVTWRIIKGAVEMSRIFLDPSGVSVVLNKLEKETVKRAVAYGMDFLIGNEIRVTPGAINFKYPSKYSGPKEVIFQYVIIYKPIDIKKGRVEIRFYLPDSIEPPDPNKFSKFLQVPDLQHNLLPFIVEIRGIVEKDEFGNYRWINERGEISHPFVNITFPDNVPDFGIKPLSWWEKYVLKPIESTIKEVEIIITKVTGKSLGLTDIWEEVKKFISKIKSFVPAAVVEPPTEPLTKVGQEVGQKKPEEENIKETETKPEIKPILEEKPKPMTLEEIQEMLDDIAERIDVISVDVAKLTGKEIVWGEEEENLVEEKIEEAEIEEPEEELEEEIEEEIEELEETTEVGEVVWCERISQPARNKVIFNEIAWMGTTNSSNDEWIELKNISGSEVNLDGWQILNRENRIKIFFNNQHRVLSNGFWVLERTNDDIIPHIQADFIYTGALKNSDEALYLFDKNCQLQDEVFANPNWPAGDNSSKRTMERRLDFSWQTSANSGGTPRNENSSGYVAYYGGGASPPPQSESEPKLTSCSQENLTEPTYSPVIINEVTWMGTSAQNSTDEWFELKNISENQVSLEGWQILDKVEQIKIIFESQDSIPDNRFYLLERTDDSSVPNVSADKIYNGALGDSDESLRLFDQNCNLIDEVLANIGENLDWPAGNKEERRSMERKEDLTWQTYLGEGEDGIMGTPKAENSQPEEVPPPLNHPPTASFTYTPENPIINQEILFDASSSTDPDGTITGYIWDFGDGNSTTTSQATTTHSYSTSGVEYVVTLQVVDDQSTTSLPETTTLTIIEKPTLEVVINEIAWMGTKAGSTHQWIELYNNTDADIDLSGWRLYAEDNSPDIIIGDDSSSKITVNYIIPTKGYYLLEWRSEARINEPVISNVTADWYGTFGAGGLKNAGEKLFLLNNEENLIDLVDGSDSWFSVGVASPSYISMERIDSTTSGNISSNWANNNLITRKGLSSEKEGIKYPINGTPKAKNSVSISPTTISTLPFDEFSEITLTYLGHPYIVQTDLIIPTTTSTLKIEPGVILKFNSGMEIKGKLEAIGESDKKIVFTSIKDDDFGGDTNNDSTSTQPSPGDWDWLYFEGSSGSELKNVILRYGGKVHGGYPLGPPFTRGMIQVKNGEITIEDSIVEKSLTIGLWLINSSSTINRINFLEIEGTESYEKTASLFIEEGNPVIKNSLFQNNKVGIWLTSSATPQIEDNIFENNTKAVYLNNASILFKNNLVENNNVNGILVGPDCWSTTTWEADLPFVGGGISISSEGSLILQPGTVIKLKDGAIINVQGKIVAQGTFEKKIIFTSFKDDEYGGDTNNDGSSTFATSSDWHYLRFFNSNSFFENVIFRYGGKEGMPWFENFGVITLENKDIEIKIKDSIIENNIYGLSVWDNTNCEIINPIINKFKAENVIFRNNKSDTYPQCSTL